MLCSVVVVVVVIDLLLIDRLRFQQGVLAIELNDYEPRIFDHIPAHCHDCLSYRDIIFTQLTEIPERAFVNFNLGPRDTFMILNGRTRLHFQPYAFQSLIINKPNGTLTLTLAAPNSWLNITENTFHGLDLRPYSTFRIIIKYVYGCKFSKDSLSGIHMGKSSRLIIDVSSVTEVHFDRHVIRENDWNSSVEFHFSRMETIRFDSFSFSSLIRRANENLSFYFELVSHVHFKSYSFQSLKLRSSSSIKFDGLFLTRLTIDSYAFETMFLESNAVFNMTIGAFGTWLCLKSYSFHSLQTPVNSENVLVYLEFFGVRSLSVFSHAFANLSLNHHRNHLQIHSINPFNDRNLLVNLASDTFSSKTPASILLNFSHIHLLHFEEKALPIDLIKYEIFLKDINFVDFSSIDFDRIQSPFRFHFDGIRWIRWPNISINDEKRTLIEFNFDHLSNDSCAIYGASRSIPWLFTVSRNTLCHCPLLYAYKLGQLDGQTIPCLQMMSGHEAAELMDQCDFDRAEHQCQRMIDSISRLNQNDTETRRAFDSIEFNAPLIRQLYAGNYLSCSFNYSFSLPPTIIRSRLLNNIGLVVGIIFAIFFLLLIIVMALLNGLQYKMREYDESWTWRRTASWSTLRRTLSQSSLRRSRRDLRTFQHEGLTSKSDNQLDRFRSVPMNDGEYHHEHAVKQSYSIQEDLKRFHRL